MKKGKMPESNMPGVISDALFPQPVKPSKSSADKKSDVIEQTSTSSVNVKNSLPSEEDIKETKPKTSAKKIRVVTYCSEENYTEFEKAFSDVKSRFRVLTGKKMAETHFAEIAMMAGIELFIKNPEAFVARITDQNKKK